MAAEIGVLEVIKHIAILVATICMALCVVPDSFAHDSSGKSEVNIKITAGKTELRAVLYNNPTAREFAELLPIRINVFDRIGLVKTAVLPNPISDSGERTRRYELGSIFYWPEGPEVAFCYSSHLPETVVDIIHIGMLQSDTGFLRSYTGELLIEAVE